MKKIIIFCDCCGEEISGPVMRFKRRKILNMGTEKEVYDYCRRMIDIFFQDGGFVFNQEHNILGDVPPQNIMAMYKAVEDARR